MKEGMKNGYFDRLVNEVKEYERQLMKEKSGVGSVINCVTKARNTTTADEREVDDECFRRSIGITLDRPHSVFFSSKEVEVLSNGSLPRQEGHSPHFPCKPLF
jgi:hypothetical protein